MRHAEEGYPKEVCGFILGVLDDPGKEVVRRVTNIADREHGRDPEIFPRDARTSYRMDPLELRDIEEDADRKGLQILAVYHSHPDHEAYFSEVDRRDALLGGEPPWPGRYIVVSVRVGRAVETQAYEWDSEKRDFVNVGRLSSK